MNRSEKQVAIDYLSKEFKTAKIAILTKFSGMTVAQMTDLRGKLRSKGAKYKVVKNTLARIAVKGTSFEQLKAHFKQPIGVAYSDNDPISPVKVVTEFLKDEAIPFSYVTSFLDGKELSAGEFKNLASLPSREEMLSKLLGSMNAPAQNMVNVLAAVPRQLVTVLAAVRDQKK